MKKLLLILLLGVSLSSYGQTLPNFWAQTSGTNTYTVNVQNFQTGNSRKIANVRFATTNSGASTINIGSQGAIPLRKWNGTAWVALVASDINVNLKYTLWYDDINTWYEMQPNGTSSSGGTGDVVGPGSSVNNNVVFFNGTTGKLIKDSGLTLSGTNTGDQTITLTGDATGSGIGSFAVNVGRVNGVAFSGLATGILKNTTGTGVPSIAVAGDFPTLNQSTTGSAATLTTGRTIAITGDLAYTSPSFNGSGNVTAAGTLATVNSNVGSFGTATQSSTITVNAKGLITAASNTTITPAVGSITGLGTGVATWMAAPSWTNFNTAITGTAPYWSAATGVALTGNNTVSGAFNIGFTNTSVGIGSSSGNSERLEVAGNIISQGVTWTIRTSASNNNWNSVAYGNGLFVAVSDYTGSGDEVMTSTDGIVWYTGSCPSGAGWRSITYGNGLFVAVGSGGTDAVMTSPDGYNWTARNSPVTSIWSSVTYGKGLFVAVSTSGVSNQVIMTSPDGITWTARTEPSLNYWSSVVYGNGQFVAVSYTGTGDRVMTSPDGITWTSQVSAADNNWNAITYGNGLFVAVASSGASRVMTSPDGVTWTSRTASAANSWGAITYAYGLYTAVSFTGTGTRVMTSYNGITWVTRTSAADNSWTGITAGNGLVVAVSVTGSGNRVMTSGKQDFIVIPTASSSGGGGSGDMLLGTSQTVTALKTFNSGTFALRNSANTFSYNFLGSAIVANRDVTIPLLTGNDVFVMAAFSQTLTNKTINGSSNTITNVSLSSGVTGNLPVANLNSGTSASGTTFWAGDATWKAPFTLTTTGTSGAATFTSGTLNIPQYSGGGGGITNGAAANEMMKSDGTNAVPSGLASSTLGYLDLGIAGTTGGVDRWVEAKGSASDLALALREKGTSGVFIGHSSSTFTQINSGAFYIPAASLIRLSGTGNVSINNAASGPAANGYNLSIEAGAAGSGNQNGGTLKLTGGVKTGSGVDGNVEIDTRTTGSIKFTSALANDNALTDVMVRDSGTGLIKYRTAASLGVGAMTAASDASDADFSISVNTFVYLPAATLTTNRTITIPAGTNGDQLEFYNNETGFSWNLAGASVYLADGVTLVTSLLANTNTQIRKVSGKWRINN